MNENFIITRKRHETATYRHYLANAVMPVASFAIEKGHGDPNGC
jgi:hypothetical protein